MPTEDKKRHGRTLRRADDGSRSSTTRDERRLGGSELRPFAHPVTDALVLAAADRAERHQSRGQAGVMLGDIFEHMGFIYNGAATRQLRPRLDALLAAGLLEQTRRYGVRLLVLTSAGRQGLAQARRRDEAVELPESPQHRKWRHSRASAAERIGGYREQLRVLLDDTRELLDTAARSRSDSWFSLADRLPAATMNVGAAIYCIQEWAEPDDAHPDLDDYSDPGDDKLDPDERRQRSSLRSDRRHVIQRKIA